MFERFTDRARQTVVFAQEEARRLNHATSVPSTFCSADPRSEGLAAQALGRTGNVARRAAHRRGTHHRRRRIRSPPGHIPFSPRSKKVLELSLREALELGHNYIGTEHILLGLVREGEGVAAQVLVARGADLKRVRNTVLGLLRNVQADPRRVGPPRTAGGQEALANAQQLAGGAAVGSHHLLEALARSEDSLASKVLISLGIDADILAAKIDELGIEGTSDITPEEIAARQMEVRLEGDAVHVVMRDQEAVQLVQAIVDSLGGPVRGDDASIGSLSLLRQEIVANLEELRARVAPTTDEPDASSRPSTIVGKAIQARLARRRARSSPTDQP